MSGFVHRVERVEAREDALALEFPRTIARGTTHHAQVVRVTLHAGGRVGRGEAAPMTHYGDSNARAIAEVEGLAAALRGGVTREALLALLPPGGARNALDAALWDLEAQATGADAVDIAGLAAVKPVVTAYTIPIDAPDRIERLAARERHRPLIKVKLGRFESDRTRLEIVRRAAPDVTLIVDANEGWSLAQLEEMAPIARDLGVALIEQPLAANEDAVLEGRDFGVPLCADESCHTREWLDRCVGRYAFVNIKLDKAGGATEALALAKAAQARGFRLMIGCTSGSTLGIAPAYLVAQHCDFCDLDAPLHLASREEAEIAYDGSSVTWSPRRRWGIAG